MSQMNNISCNHSLCPIWGYFKLTCNTSKVVRQKSKADMVTSVTNLLGIPGLQHSPLFQYLQRLHGD